MVIDSHLSRKISRISFFCAALIVLLHSAGGPVGKLSPATRFAQEFLCQGVTRVAVPMFFVIFGFLLFRDYEFSIAWYLRKLKARGRSLMVPYALWSLIGLLFAVALNVVCTKQNMVCEWSSVGWWLRVLGVTCAPLASYHLWFVRDCIIVVLLSPLVGWTLRRMGATFAVLVWALFLSGVPVWGECLPWVIAGGVLSSDGKKIIEKLNGLASRKGVGVVLLLGWLAILFARSYCEWHEPRMDALVNAWGCVAVWKVYDGLSELLLRCVDAVASSSFFVYCAHTLVMFPVRFVCERSHLLNLYGLAYLGVKFAATLAIVLWVWWMFKRFFPKVYNVISGGR